MRYLITTPNHPPFLTKWFEAENNFAPEEGMIVYDLALNLYTTDGETWKEIEFDHL